MQGLRNGLGRGLDLGVPLGELSREDRRRARILTGATLGLVAMITPTFLFYTQELGVGLLAWVLVAVGALAVANLVVLRRTGALDLACHAGVGLLVGWLTIENLVAGGLHDPNFAWFYVIPLAALLVSSPRGGAVWAAVTVAITAGFYALDTIGWSAPALTAAEDRGIQALYNRVTAVIAFGVLAWSFLRGQRRLEAELTREAAYVNLVRHTAVSANEADSFAQALHDAAARIAREMGWMIGQVYRVDAEGVACFSSTAHVAPELEIDFGSLAEFSERLRHAPGHGLPGLALASKRVVTLRTEDASSEFPRARLARELGVRTSYAIPIMAHGEVVAVIEFASAGDDGRDPRLEGVLAHIGDRLGRMAERLASSERQQISRRISAVGHLAAGLAHELNNPLSYARSNLSQLAQEVELLAEKASADAGVASQLEECDQLLRETTEGVERAIHVVRDVRKISHLEHSDFEQVDVEQWLQEAVRFATARAPDGVAVDVSTPAGLSLQGAPNLLHQVMVNLVENAIQSVGAHGQVRLVAREQAEGILVRVHDDGPGFEEGIAERLFEPFATTRPDGTGLGLFLVYEIVRRHGGRISAEGRSGEGATFELWLPARQQGGASAGDAPAQGG